MIISFTGTQLGMTDFQKSEVNKIITKYKEDNEIIEFIHGDCVGADEQANQIAFNLGIDIFSIYPPDDFRKRAYCFDKTHVFKYNKIITPYVDILTPSGRSLKVKWYPTEAYLKRNKKIVDAASIIVACPKEFQHTIRSGTWSTIRYAWKTKKDNVIVIPPIDRPTED